jgi:hypothetical protein
MTSPFRDRRRAGALDRALERYHRLLESGLDPEAARAQARAALGAEDARLFLIAATLPETAAPVPEPEFAEMFAARLRRAQVRPATSPVRDAAIRVLRPRPRLGFGFAAVAAAIAIFAGVLVPAFRSLPGDPLYALKRASERTQVAFASGSGEARLRLDLAGERFDEVHRLVERAHMSAFAPGVGAAAVTDDITDPHLVQLINDTLEEAGRELASAAKILIAAPSDGQDLDTLLAATQRGKKLAEDVAADLPPASQPPALDSVVQFAKIEAQAKAARSNVAAPPTLQPCDTPTPTPTASPLQSTEPTPTPTATPTPTPTVSPELTPTPTPTGTPCITPTPSPTPVPATEATATPVATPSTGPADQGAGTSDSNAQPADQPADGSQPQGADPQPADGQPSA